MIEQSRNKWMDVARGITILLMILGHTSIPEQLSRFIYSFHMPLFFISSGWMTNWLKYSFKQFAGRRIETLVMPFVIYSGIVLLLLGFKGSDWLIKGWQGYALWFIPVLFFALLIVRLIFLMKRKWVKCIMCLCLLITAVLLKMFNISLTWSLNVVPYACFLIMLGTYLKKYQSILETFRWTIIFLGFVISLVVSYFWKLDMAWNNIIPVIPLTIGAVAGTAMIFSMSTIIVQYIPKVGLYFQYVGKETFVIVAFSQAIVILCNAYFTINPIIKYLILFVSLWLIISVKNRIKILLK